MWNLQQYAICTSDPWQLQNVNEWCLMTHKNLLDHGGSNVTFYYNIKVRQQIHKVNNLLPPHPLTPKIKESEPNLNF